MVEDPELLRSYAEERSQAAFTELVQRHLKLVYSVALRQVGGDAHLAQDVTQKVFHGLAQKAAVLSRRAVISGWLCQAAKFAASDLVRAEQRRRRREKETEMMQHTDSGLPEGKSDLERLRPVLDDIMAQLGEADRDAIALRFFEDRSFPEIGVALRLTEEAARKRVDRALGKMHAKLLRRGIQSSAMVLTTALSGQMAVTVPAHLMGTVVSSVLATAGAVAGVSTFAFMSLTKIQIGVTVGVVATTAGFVSWYYQSNPPAYDASRPATVAAVPQSAVPIPSSSADTNAPVPLKRAATGAEQKSPPGSAASDAAQRAAQDQRAIIRRYSALFTKLGLTEEQRGKLIQILMQDREASLDFASASAATGLDASQNPAFFNDSVHELRANLAGEINALLGDELYARFVAGNEAVRKDAVVQRTQKDLKDLGIRMNTTQADKLRQLLDELDVHYIDDEVLARAGEFLSRDQMEVLKMQHERRAHGEKKEKIQQAIQQNLH